MRLYATSELARQTETELSVLFNACNLELARAEPFSPAWHIASANVETILRVRKQRAQQYKPQWP